MLKSNTLDYISTSIVFRIALPVFVFIAVSGYLHFRFPPGQPMYRASARIWIQRAFFTGHSGAEPGEVPDSPLVEGNSNLNTFCEVVQSDAVLNLAYDELSKKLPANQVPEREALGAIHVVPSQTANIISLDYTAADPKVAVAVVKAVLTAVMQENARQIANPLEDTRARLEKQLSMARQQYSDVKNKLSAFQHATDSVDFKADSETLAAERADLQKNLEDCNNEMQAIRTKMSFLQQQLGFGPDDVLAVEKISNDEVVQGLKKTIAETQVKLIELKSKFQDEHPKVKRMNAMLDDAKKEIADRYSVLIGKVDPKFDGLSSTSPVQGQLLNDMVMTRSDILAGEAKIASLKKSLAEINAQLSSVPKKRQELADLEREDALNSNTLAAIESELQRVKLTESVSLSTSKLQVIDSSEFMVNSTPMLRRMAVQIGLACAAVLALIQYLLDPRLLSANQTSNLPMQLIGWIPRTKIRAQSVPGADRLRSVIRHWLIASKYVWITSANAGDGKSTLALALAESFADSGSKVMLIDANLEHPSLHLALKRNGAPGLAQCLDSTASLSQAISVVRPCLSFMPAGGVTHELRALSTGQFERLLKELSEFFDIVIIDSPSAGDGIKSLHLPEIRLNVLVVARLRNTFKRSLQALDAELNGRPLAQIGLVLNDIQDGRAVMKLLQQPNASVSTSPAAMNLPETSNSGSVNW